MPLRYSNEVCVNKTAHRFFGVYGRAAITRPPVIRAWSVPISPLMPRSLMLKYLQDPKAFVIANTQNKTTAMTYALKDATQPCRCHRLFVQTLKEPDPVAPRKLRSPGRGAPLLDALHRWFFLTSPREQSPAHPT